MQLRWGICSVGRISFDFTDALVSLPAEEHKVVAAAASDEERARQFANKFDIPKAYGSYAELANDAEVNIVYVGVTTNAHYELSLQFLRAGKHVLCEKPLACAAWQAEELVALAKEKQLFLMEAVWSRCFPLYTSMRELIKSGELGKINFLEAHFMSDGANALWRDRLTKTDLGGGSLWDQGVYALQLADWIFGEEPVKVHAVGSLLDSGVDGSVCITLQYADGRFANLTTSLCVAQEKTAVVYGSSANLVIAPPFHTPLRLTVAHKAAESRTLESAPLPKVKFPTNYRLSEGLVYEAQHVADCLRRGLLESPLVPHSLSLWMQRTIDDCLKQIGRRNLPTRSDA